MTSPPPPPPAFTPPTDCSVLTVVDIQTCQRKENATATKIRNHHTCSSLASCEVRCGDRRLFFSSRPTVEREAETHLVLKFKIQNSEYCPWMLMDLQCITYLWATNREQRSTSTRQVILFSSAHQHFLPALTGVQGREHPNRSPLPFDCSGVHNLTNDRCLRIVGDAATHNGLLSARMQEPILHTQQC